MCDKFKFESELSEIERAAFDAIDHDEIKQCVEREDFNYPPTLAGVEVRYGKEGTGGHRLFDATFVFIGRDESGGKIFAQSYWGQRTSPPCR